MPHDAPLGLGVVREGHVSRVEGLHAERDGAVAVLLDAGDEVVLDFPQEGGDGGGVEGGVGVRVEVEEDGGAGDGVGVWEGVEASG